MKISARVNTQFEIAEEDMRIVIAYARWLNDADQYDSEFHIENEKELEEKAVAILSKTFGDCEGYIPGSWLDDYANDIGYETHKWKRGCADIDMC